MVEYFCPCCDYSTNHFNHYYGHFRTHLDKEYVIYKIDCDCGKMYIGSTECIKERLRIHKRDILKHKTWKLYEHIKNCPWNINVIYDVPDEKNVLELELIFMVLYNTVNNGLNSRYPVLKDTARKIANSVLKNTDLAKNIKGMHQNGLVIKYKGSI